MLRALAVVLAFSACQSVPSRPAASDATVAAAPVADGLVRRPGVARIVAIGDLHGDLERTRAAFRLAGAVDAQDQWIGGALIVVQTGDQTDRGDDEREILEYLDVLAPKAAAAGGALIVLNGNHELMQVAQDFRYVTPGGFDDWGGPEGRLKAFAPGATWARELAERPIYAIVGDTLFAHAGAGPENIDGLEELDREARAWMRGESRDPPRALVDDEGPVWTRRYGFAEDPAICASAARMLDRVGLRRMVVGHTVQAQGVNAICEGRVWRIDVGLARLYGGPLQVLEITAEGARKLE
jgi:hypothetical protein